MTASSRLLRAFPSLGLILVAACGGGGGDGTGPAAVARVDVTTPNLTLEIGQSTQLQVKYYDDQSVQLSGRTISYSSSNQASLLVSGTGLVTAVAVGSATISAVVDGVVGSLSINSIVTPVATVAITPPSPSVVEGQTITLTGQARSSQGTPLTDRTVSWTSANTARATVSSSGVVTGVTPGYVYIRATADARTDSINLRVRTATPPSISAGPAGEMAAGASATITGTNFGATPADNTVYLNGVVTQVTAASPTSITFTVPARNQLPCTATGAAQVIVAAKGDSATTSGTLRVATARTLNVGESLLLTSQSDLLCTEFLGAGGRYLFTTFHSAGNAGIRASFQVTGRGPATAATVATVAPALVSPVTRQAQAQVFSKGTREVQDRQVRHLKAHTQFMAQERQLARQMGPARAARSQAAQRAPRALAAVQPPSIGDIVTYRMRRTLNTFTLFDEVGFRVVYSGTKIVIMEDPASPMAGAMDHEYVRLGEEFDQVMMPILNAFGDPLVSDHLLDDNGRMIALFSPRVNAYEINGQSNQILGFVTICDFFPRTGNAGVDACPVSNEGEFFYALVPDTDAGWTIGFWRRLIRGTLIHEAKHVGSYGWRWFLNASDLEETWLEEATAQAASEMFALARYGKMQKADATWLDGPNCDYAPESAECPDPAEGILHHYSFLYDHYESNESKSILDDPFVNGSDPVVYGSSWSFVRYLADNYAASDAALFGPIVQVQNDRGVANITSKVGKPFSELLGMWSLASLADNYPGAPLADPRLQLPSWQSRDLFQSMNEFLRGANNSVIFAQPWPLQVRQVPFGNFTTPQSTVSNLKGGGFVAFEMSGLQAGPQAIGVRSTSGGAPPSNVGLAIVRIQ